MRFRRSSPLPRSEQPLDLLQAPKFTPTQAKRGLESTPRTKTCSWGPRSGPPGFLLSGSLFPLFVAGFGAADKGGGIVVEFFQVRFPDVDHVPGLVPVVLDILCQVGGDGQ